jgi:TPR repeat protein
VDGLYDLAERAFLRIHGMVKRGEASWASLPAGLQAEVDEAVAMLIEAAAQGHMCAQFRLGVLFDFGWGVAQDDGRAFELYIPGPPQVLFF